MAQFCWRALCRFVSILAGSHQHKEFVRYSTRAWRPSKFDFENWRATLACQAGCPRAPRRTIARTPCRKCLSLGFSLVH